MNLITPRPNVTVDGLAKSGQISPKGLVKHREHWDGRVDAKVLPGTINVKVTPKWSEYLKLIELEDAVAERRRAVASGDRDAIRRTEYRVAQARARFENVKLGQRVVEAVHVQQA